MGGTLGDLGHFALLCFVFRSAGFGWGLGRCGVGLPVVSSPAYTPGIVFGGWCAHTVSFLAVGGLGGVLVGGRVCRCVWFVVGVLARLSCKVHICYGFLAGYLGVLRRHVTWNIKAVESRKKCRARSMDALVGLGGVWCGVWVGGWVCWVSV